jgi:hypothetical protein
MVVEYDDILINYFGVHFSSLEGIDETFSHAMSYIKPHQNETFIMYSFNHFFFFFFFFFFFLLLVMTVMETHNHIILFGLL